MAKRRRSKSAVEEPESTVSFRLPNTLRAQLEQIAQREERSLNGQVVYFLHRAAQEQVDGVRLEAW